MTQRSARAATRDRLRLLATLAELRAEVARRPLIHQRLKVSKLKEEIDALAATRKDLRASVDGISSGVTSFGHAAYLVARSGDLRDAEAQRYQALALTEAEMADLRDKASQAHARAEILVRLCRATRKP